MSLRPIEKQSLRIMERHFASKHREGLLRYEVLLRTRRAFDRAADQFPPANLDLIAKNLGVVSITREPIALDGLLVLEEAGYSIKIRAEHPPARQRFTIAHELGHLIVREAGNLAPPTMQAQICAPGARSAWEEELCDYAAGQLLIPDDWAWEFLGDREPSFSTIAEMAKLCETSLEVAARRVVEQPRWKCRIVWWTLERGWFRATRSFPRYEWTTLDEMRLPRAEPCLIADVLRDGRPRCGTQSVDIEGTIQKYQVEAWKASKNSVASLVIFDRPPRIRQRRRTLFD
jgi:Zn-dependent peptidase ImmA (M78 family)